MKNTHATIYSLSLLLLTLFFQGCADPIDAITPVRTSSDRNQAGFNSEIDTEVIEINGRDFGDIPLSDPVARVDLCDTNFYDQCATPVTQPTVRWSNDRIVVKKNLGHYNDSQDLFLYIFDDQDHLIAAKPLR